MENKIRLLALSLIFTLISVSGIYCQGAADEKFYSGEQDDRFFEEYKGSAENSTGSEISASTTDSGYYLVNTDKGAQFVQRLVWDDSGYVDHYTITIEQYNKRTKKYTVIAENETTTTSTEVSLSAGTYRYKIAIYNILGQLEIETDYEEFEIDVAYDPRISDVTPSAMYMEENPDGNIIISGHNIRSNASIELRREGKKNGGYIPDVKEVSSRGNRVNLHFDINSIAPGKYNVVITNPGGLTAKSEDITIRYKKQMDFDLSAGYALNWVMFDDTFNTYLGTPVYPLSAALKMTFIPYKSPYGYFGCGVLASYSYMFKEYDRYKITGNFISAQLNFVYQYPFAERRIFFEAFAGGGIVYFMNFQFEFERGIKSPYTNIAAPSADIGVAMQFYFTKRLFIDVTVPFVYAFTKDMQFGTLIPQVTVGWQF